MPFQPPGPKSYPSTFEPVLNEDFLNSLYSGINQDEAGNVGKARGESLARGLTGDPFEASAVGSARTAGSNQRQGALSNFLYGLASMKEKENIIGEGQAYGTSERQGAQDFSASQNALDRDFRFRLAEMGYQAEADRQSHSDLYGLYGGIAQGIGGAVGRGIGAYAAGGL